MNLPAFVTGNKNFIMAAIGGLMAALAIYKISKYEELGEQKKAKLILQLKKTINTNNPSQKDIIKIFEACLQPGRQNIEKLVQINKQKRKKYHMLKCSKQSKQAASISNQNFQQYLRFINKSVEQVEMAGINSIYQFGVQLGVDCQVFKKWEGLMEATLKNMTDLQSQSVAPQQIRRLIKQQINFVKSEGKFYADLFILSINKWKLEQKQQIKQLFPYIMMDIMLQKYPQYSSGQVFNLRKKYENQLFVELQQLQLFMMPLILKINSSIYRSLGPQQKQKKQNENDLKLSPEDLLSLSKIEKQQMDNYAEIGHMIEQVNR